MMIPQFDPAITEHDGVTRYHDGRVSGVVEVSGRRLTISSWSSMFPGNGHTLQALQWLRSRGFTRIVVTGVIIDAKQLTRDALSYWLHVQSLGLVEKLVDDAGELIGDVGARGVDAEFSVDEFTMQRLFGGVSDNIKKISTILAEPANYKASPSPARQRMMTYAVLDAFSRGQLKNQKDPLEDTHLLHDLLGNDPPRYSSLCRAICSMNHGHSERAAISLIRHTRDVGMVSFDAGWEYPLTFLFNASTGQVMSASGVQPIRAVHHGHAMKIYSPEEARARQGRQQDYESDIAHFGVIAELICEDQGIRLG